MSTALTVQSEKWTPDQIQLLKDTVCKGSTDDEFKIFCYAVQRTGLDPFMKQIHSVKRNGTMCIQTGIDGYRLIAHRTNHYAGIDAILFDNESNPNKATATVYRIVQGVRCAFTATARWSEYYPGEKQGFMWKKMPCVMLGKVAESIALRMAFPAELSGLYTDEEMDQANRELQDTPKIIPQVPDELLMKKAEGQKIKLLRTELGLTEQDLIHKISELHKTEDFKTLTLDQMKQVTLMLESEKKLVDESASSDVPWMQETMGQMR